MGLHERKSNATMKGKKNTQPSTRHLFNHVNIECTHLVDVFPRSSASALAKTRFTHTQQRNVCVACHVANSSGGCRGLAGVPSAFTHKPTFKIQRLYSARGVFPSASFCGRLASPMNVSPKLFVVVVKGNMLQCSICNGSKMR